MLIPTIALALAAATTGAFFRRWMGSAADGSWLGRVSGGVRRGLGLALGAAVSAIAAAFGGADLTHIGAAAAIGAFVCVAWTMPHGDYMDMGNMPSDDDSFFRRWFGDIEHDGIRDFIGMATIYSIFTIPGGAALWVLGFAGYFVIPAGVLVACAYWLGWKILPVKNGIDRPTIAGEYAAGALVYGALALA